MNRTIKLFAIVLLATLGSTAHAQETAGQNPTSTKGAVIKDKAPVNKRLLKIKLPVAQEVTLKNGLHVVGAEYDIESNMVDFFEGA